HLDHADAAVHVAAALGLCRLGPQRVPLDRLLALAAGSNQDVRAAAAGALRQKLAAVTRADVPALRQGLRNPARAVRLAFLDALASLKEGGAEAAADVAGLLTSPEPEVRIHAIRALKTM